jgi:hypothetical protein
VRCLVARYAPSRRYLALALFAVGGTALASWSALRWSPNWIAAGLFALSALFVFALAARPAIEIHETHLKIGKQEIPWGEIRRVDQTKWNAPLAVHLTLEDERRLLLIYPGDIESSANLLRQLRRYSRVALLDGVPHGQFWGETAAAAEPKQLPPPRYPLLRPEDEEEVERMFQRLKSVGRLDPRGSDEK